MNKNKHTPGPWRACGADRGGCECRQIWSIPGDCPVVTARGECIGIVNGKWGDGPKMIYGEVPKEQQQANVRLIVAAPKMFAYLQNLVNYNLINEGHRQEVLDILDEINKEK